MSFPQAARGLQTSGLLARLPRAPIDEYLTLAQVAHWLSLESFEQCPDPEYGGGIESAIATIAREAARTISDLVWMPLPLRWLRVHSATARIRVSEDAVGEVRVQELLVRSRQHGF